MRSLEGAELEDISIIESLFCQNHLLSPQEVIFHKNFHLNQSETLYLFPKKSQEVTEKSEKIFDQSVSNAKNHAKICTDLNQSQNSKARSFSSSLSSLSPTFLFKSVNHNPINV